MYVCIYLCLVCLSSTLDLKVANERETAVTDV